MTVYNEDIQRRKNLRELMAKIVVRLADDKIVTNTTYAVWESELRSIIDGDYIPDNEVKNGQ